MSAEKPLGLLPDTPDCRMVPPFPDWRWKPAMKLRLRVTRALVLLVALLGLFTHHVYSEDSVTDTLLGAGGFILLVIAAGGRIWAGAYVTGRKNRTLVTDGPFSLVRNPLYVFSFLGFVGAGLSFESLTLAAVFGATFFVAHWPTIRTEERILEGLFGQAYRRYCSRVPRFIPVLRRPHAGGVLDLDIVGFVRTVVESMAIPLVFVLAELAEWAKLNELLPVLVRLP